MKDKITSFDEMYIDLKMPIYLVPKFSMGKINGYSVYCITIDFLFIRFKIRFNTKEVR